MQDSSTNRFSINIKTLHVVQICVILIHGDSNYQSNAGPFNKNIYSKHHLLSPN